MKEKLYDYDPAESLDSEEAIEAFLQSAQETGDEVYIQEALKVVERARKK